MMTQSSKLNQPIKTIPKSTQTIKLTEAQQLVLVKASQNEHGELIDPGLKRGFGTKLLKGAFGATPNDRRMIEAFMRKGLVEGESNDLFDLHLTARAFAVLNIDKVEWPERLRGENCGEATDPLDDTEPSSMPARILRKGSKGSRVIAQLYRKRGATLAQMEEATGWQRHSIHGFLSGIVRKKLGLRVECSTLKNGDRIYQINSEARS